MSNETNSVSYKVSSSTEFVSQNWDIISSDCDSIKKISSIPSFVDSEGILYSTILEAIKLYDELSEKMVTRIKSSVDTASLIAQTFDEHDHALKKKAGEL